jgi:hypothetical protein
MQASRIKDPECAVIATDGQAGALRTKGGAEKLYFHERQAFEFLSC